MEAKPDAGDIVAQKEVEITLDDTAHSLFLKLASAARQLMRDTLPQLLSGRFPRVAQTGPSSYYGGRRPEDGLIDWSSDALTIYNLIRAVTHPYPGAFTFMEGKKLFIWRAAPVQIAHTAPTGTFISTDPLVVATHHGAIRLISVQLNGEPEAAAEVFVKDRQLEGKRLGGAL
jgi:methionyl-tRNA formyltransferase